MYPLDFHGVPQHIWSMSSGTRYFTPRSLAETNERLGRVHRVVLTFAINTAEHGVHTGREEHDIGGCFRMRHTRRATGVQALLERVETAEPT